MSCRYVRGLRRFVLARPQKRSPLWLHIEEQEPEHVVHAQMRREDQPEVAVTGLSTMREVRAHAVPDGPRIRSITPHRDGLRVDVPDVVHGVRSFNSGSREGVGEARKSLQPPDALRRPFHAQTDREDREALDDLAK
jgi:hypothetical protein